MATKIKSVFFCQSCGYESSKWMGQCPGCKEWNTFVEETVKPAAKAAKGISASGAQSGTYVAPVAAAIYEYYFSDGETPQEAQGENSLIG